MCFQESADSVWRVRVCYFFLLYLLCQPQVLPPPHQVASTLEPRPGCCSLCHHCTTPAFTEMGCDEVWWLLYVKRFLWNFTPGEKQNLGRGKDKLPFLKLNCVILWHLVCNHVAMHVVWEHSFPVYTQRRKHWHHWKMVKCIKTNGSC